MLRRTLSYASPKTKQEFVKLLYGRKLRHEHRTSDAKPDVVAVLLQLPPHKINEAVKRAVATNELDKASFLSLLKRHRYFQSFESADATVRAYQESGKQLTSQQISVMMALATDRGQWRAALGYWSLAASTHKTECAHGALLNALRACSKWRMAVQHFETMVADKVVPDCHALHSMMNTLRVFAPWTSALRAFSCAVQAGTKPSPLIFLLLLRCLQKSQLPSRWEVGLAVLEALRGKFERNAGMYNPVLETLGNTGRWVTAVRLFHSMEASNIAPSRETLRVMMELRKSDDAFLVRVLAQCHLLAMPVTAEMYRIVFAALLRQRQAAADVEHLITSEIARSCEDPGNPNHKIVPISVALLDTLLELPRVDQASHLADTFHHLLEGVNADATKGIGSVGIASQRWLVHGRVAVVDHLTLLAAQFESLHHHYDGIIVPYAAVRTLARMTATMSNDGKLGYVRYVLRSLHQKVTDPNGAYSMVRVLPLLHQIHAHAYLATAEAGASDTDIALVRKEARHVSLLAAFDKDGSSDATGGGDDDGVLTVRGGAADSRSRSGAAVRELRDDEDEDEAGLPVPVTPAAPARPFLDGTNRLQRAHQIIAVGVMLRAVNPEASIHVVTPSEMVLGEVAKWNAFDLAQPRASRRNLTPVRFPSELAEKAPTALQAARHRQIPQDAVHTKKRLTPAGRRLPLGNQRVSMPS